MYRLTRGGHGGAPPDEEAQAAHTGDLADSLVEGAAFDVAGKPAPVSRAKPGKLGKEGEGEK